VLLAVDIGNSDIALGVFHKSDLVATSRLETSLSLAEEDVTTVIQGLIRNSGFQKEDVSGTIVGSVVPSLTPLFKAICNKAFNLQPILVSSKLDLGIELKVQHPEEVGADRICNSVAAKKLYGTPAVVVDFGTATVYDAIDEEGNFIGGAIAPGIETSTRYLIEKAALLSPITFKIPKTAIGTDTESNLQSGIVLGAVDQVEGMVRRIKAETGWKDFPVIVTGGLGKLISGLSDVISHCDGELTLKGLELIYRQVRT